MSTNERKFAISCVNIPHDSSHMESKKIISHLVIYEKYFSYIVDI